LVAAAAAIVSLCLAGMAVGIAMVPGHAGLTGARRLAGQQTSTADPRVGGPKVSVPSVRPSPSGSPAAAASVPPARLQIPTISVDAQVEAVGVDGLGRMAIPSVPAHVAWYRLGSAPGDPGDAVVDGHLDWTDGPAVFWNLGRLRVGDQVTMVRTDGSKVVFVVDGKTSYPYDTNPPGLFTTQGPPSLSLVTCAGTWDYQRHTYLQRLIVHATLAPTAPAVKPGDEGG
jgi:sortase (surface protein transpeptidase)